MMTQARCDLLQFRHTGTALSQRILRSAEKVVSLVEWPMRPPGISSVTGVGPGEGGEAPASLPLHVSQPFVSREVAISPDWIFDGIYHARKPKDCHGVVLDNDAKAPLANVPLRLWGDYKAFLTNSTLDGGSTYRAGLRDMARIPELRTHG
jgi:hypothetical protein